MFAARTRCAFHTVSAACRARFRVARPAVEIDRVVTAPVELILCFAVVRRILDHALALFLGALVGSPCAIRLTELELDVSHVAETSRQIAAVRGVPGSPGDNLLADVFRFLVEAERLLPVALLLRAVPGVAEDAEVVVGLGQGERIVSFRGVLLAKMPQTRNRLVEFRLGRGPIAELDEDHAAHHLHALWLAEVVQASGISGGEFLVVLLSLAVSGHGDGQVAKRPGDRSPLFTGLGRRLLGRMPRFQLLDKVPVLLQDGFLVQGVHAGETAHDLEVMVADALELGVLLRQLIAQRLQAGVVRLPQDDRDRRREHEGDGNQEGGLAQDCGGPQRPDAPGLPRDGRGSVRRSGSARGRRPGPRRWRSGVRVPWPGTSGRSSPDRAASAVADSRRQRFPACAPARGSSRSPCRRRTAAGPSAFRRGSRPSA